MSVEEGVLGMGDTVFKVKLQTAVPALFKTD